MDLLLHILTHLYPFFEVNEGSSFVEEDLEGGFESFIVVRGGGDVHFVVGENGIFSVHQFVK